MTSVQINHETTSVEIVIPVPYSQDELHEKPIFRLKLDKEQVGLKKNFYKKNSGYKLHSKCATSATLSIQ